MTLEKSEVDLVFTLFNSVYAETCYAVLFGVAIFPKNCAGYRNVFTQQISTSLPWHIIVGMVHVLALCIAQSILIRYDAAACLGCMQSMLSCRWSTGK